jgi:hypothetical protein
MSDVGCWLLSRSTLKGYDRRCFPQTGRWREAGVMDRAETGVNRGPTETSIEHSNRLQATCSVCSNVSLYATLLELIHGTCTCAQLHSHV